MINAYKFFCGKTERKRLLEDNDENDGNMKMNAKNYVALD
jgi:hypothetical protein